MMLTELGLKNFKAFGNVEQKAPLSKITLIYGPNSGGKSSIIQALLMLKQSMNVKSRRSATKPKLVLRGEYVDLGSFSALIHKHEQNRKLEIGIKTIFKDNFSWNVDIQLMAEKAPILSEAEYEFLSEKENLFFNAKCKYDKEKEWWLRDSGLLKKEIIEIEEFYEGHLPGKWIADAEKGLSDDGTYGYLPLPAITSDERFIAATDVRRKEAWERWLRDDFRKKVIGIVAPAIADFERLLLKMAYLGPLRSYPKRIYAVSDDARDSTGVSGEFMPHILHHDSRILKSVNKWFGQFEIPYKLSIDKIGDPNMVGEYVSLSLIDRRTKTQVTLTDVGFGINQVLPIIIEGIASPPNAIICVEQPEIHLHPRLQAETADLMIETSEGENGKQWIVETHSELLILRLQRRIREGALNHKDISVIYVDPDDDGGGEGSTIKVLGLNEEGDFDDDWPHGFFEEGFGELMAEVGG